MREREREFTCGYCTRFMTFTLDGNKRFSLMLIDLQRARGKRIAFRNGTGTEADQLVLCTGYSIDLPFLPEDVANKTINRTTNAIQVWQGKGKGWFLVVKIPG